MRRPNILYFAIIIVLYAVLHINWNYVKHTGTFYGFAENKETEINLNHPVLVHQVLVTPGQDVAKGDLLMEVVHTSTERKLDIVSHEISELQAKNSDWRNKILSDIRQWEAKKIAEQSQTDIRIQNLQAEIDLNQSLVKDLKSIEVADGIVSNSPNAIKIEGLKKELTAKLETIDLEIAELQQRLNAANAPLQMQINKLEVEQEYYKQDKEKLLIYAPMDGLIGNVHCKEGEHISSFKSLISFYERNPTIVKGFVHENLILHVNVGDTLSVASSLHPEHQDFGKVAGLGYRIVEIPERLRKIPELKTYGREVLIEIPPGNPFLQKEKVVLNLLNVEGLEGNSLFSLFQSSNPGKSQNKAIQLSQ